MLSLPKLAPRNLHHIVPAPALHFDAVGSIRAVQIAHTPSTSAVVVALCAVLALWHMKVLAGGLAQGPPCTCCGVGRNDIQTSIENAFASDSALGSASAVPSRLSVHASEPLPRQRL